MADPIYIPVIKIYVLSLDDISTEIILMAPTCLKNTPHMFESSFVSICQQLLEKHVRVTVSTLNR